MQHSSVCRGSNADWNVTGERCHDINPFFSSDRPNPEHPRPSHPHLLRSSAVSFPPRFSADICPPPLTACFYFWQHQPQQPHKVQGPRSSAQLLLGVRLVVTLTLSSSPNKTEAYMRFNLVTTSMKSDINDIHFLTICRLFSIKWAPIIPRKEPKPSWKEQNEYLKVSGL